MVRPQSQIESQSLIEFPVILYEEGVGWIKRVIERVLVYLIVASKALKEIRDRIAVRPTPALLGFEVAVVIREGTLVVCSFLPIEACFNRVRLVRLGYVVFEREIPFLPHK